MNLLMARQVYLYSTFQSTDNSKCFTEIKTHKKVKKNIKRDQLKYILKQKKGEKKVK